MEAAGVFLSGDGAGHCSSGRRGESLFGRVLDVLPYGARLRRAAANGKALRQRVAAFSDARVGHRARLVFCSLISIWLLISALVSLTLSIIGSP